MSLDADTIVDRRRMRRKLTFWRVLAVLLALCAVGAAGAALRAPGTSLLTGSPRRRDRARHHRLDPQRSDGRALERLGNRVLRR
jgi:protease-4